MQSYGTARIQDGVYVKTQLNSNEQERRGFVRLGSVREILPKPVLSKNANNKSIQVDLFYKEQVYSINGKLIKNNNLADYSKINNRIVSNKNIIKELKHVVSQYADCNEAKRVRGIALALQKIKPSISSERFKFLISGNEGGCPQGSSRWNSSSLNEGTNDI